MSLWFVYNNITIVPEALTSYLLGGLFCKRQKFSAWFNRQHQNGEFMCNLRSVNRLIVINEMYQICVPNF